MHRCADINNEMQELIGAYNNTSEQLVDLSCSRILRDHNDFQFLKDWSDVHNPFDEDEPRLKSCSSSLMMVQSTVTKQKKLVE